MKRIIFLFLSFFNYILAMDCSDFGDWKEYNGHYYAYSNSTLSFNNAKLLAENLGGYLAIPNSNEENEFIRTLIPNGKLSWIGIYDPSYSQNFCIEGTICSSDTSRFVDVKNKALSYENWGGTQPDNLIMYNDYENVTPMGEHWVVMANNGEWADVGNHVYSYQTTAIYKYVVEMESKPECYIPDGDIEEPEIEGIQCNDQVYDNTDGTIEIGNVYDCLQDEYGTYYCPSGLAPAATYWSYIEGEAVEFTSTVTDYAQGEYKELTSTVRDYANGTSTTNTGTVIDYDNGYYAEHTGTVIDYVSIAETEVVEPIILGVYTFEWWNCDGCGYLPIGKLQELIQKAGGNGNQIRNVTYGASSYANRGVVNDSKQTIQIGINSTYIDVKPGEIAAVLYKAVGNATTKIWQSAGGKPFIRGKSSLECVNWAVAPATKDYPSHTYCADEGSNDYIQCPTGYDEGLNSFGQAYCYKEVDKCPTDYIQNGNFCEKEIFYNFYSYSCPAGYSIKNSGFTTYTKTDPDKSIVNWVTLDDAVNDKNPPENNCSKIIDFNYYTYGCEDGYTIIDEGLKTCNPDINYSNGTYKEFIGTVRDFTQVEYAEPLNTISNCINENVRCEAGDNGWSRDAYSPIRELLTTNSSVKVYENGILQGNISSLDDITRIVNTCDSYGIETTSFTTGCFGGKCNRGTGYSFCTEIETCDLVEFQTNEGVGCENGCTGYYCKDADTITCPSGFEVTTFENGELGCKSQVSCPSDYIEINNQCYKDISYKYYSYSCPAGYSIKNSGFTTYTKTDPDKSIVNWVTLDDAVNDKNPPENNCVKVEPCNESVASDGNCYKDIDYNHYTYECPAGYSIQNYGLEVCEKTDPDVTVNNENSLNDSCNSSIPPEGNCTKSIEYSYYEYICTTDTNNFNESYSAINSGLTECIKEDTDLINTNEELSESCNESNSPINNCKTTEYTCNSELREPVWIDNQWQCSPFPCVGENEVVVNDTVTGINDENNDGWTEDGQCIGELLLFDGKDMRCRSSDKFFGLAGGGCCDKDKVALGLVECKTDEKKLARNNKSELCHEVGEYCSKKVKFIGCIQNKKTFCCYNSKLGRIIQEQGRPQLDLDFGTPTSPDCKGFTPDDFQKLDFGKMDLSEFYEDLEDKFDIESVNIKQTTIQDRMTETMDNLLNN